MAFALSSPVTGAAQTGFTTPTYTMTADTAPETNGKQWACTVLGGTQAGVTTHSVASPYTINFVRPKAYKVLAKPNPVTGVIVNVPMNVYHLISRKGVLPLAGQPYTPMVVRTSISVPAGADTADAPNIRGCLSLHFGAIAQQSAGIGDTTVSGIA